MPRLILLNGPPGIGKSTLAQRYVDEHPGVLNLDVDRVRTLIGGWRDRFAETGAIARSVALSMAATHLAGGRDVVLPQYLGILAEVRRFEAVAHGNGAQFREVVLMDTKEHCLDRFTRRGQDDGLPWHQQVQQIVERDGGMALLARMHDQLGELLTHRPDASILPSHQGAIDNTYQRLLALLEDG